MVAEQLPALLQRAQAAALALMTDTCTITRVTGATTDKATGVRTPVVTTIYAGRCRIQIRASVARPLDVGQAHRFGLPVEVQLPVTASGIASDDMVTVTTSPTDPDLVGRTYAVRALSNKTHQSANRITCEEFTS